MNYTQRIEQLQKQINETRSPYTKSDMINELETLKKLDK